jgi:predicted negative regulator of RcsB-dependent stress response
MPADSIVNDHYGDVLWKNGKKIQARYYWNYVLNLEKTKNDLKKSIKNKLMSGI